MLSFEISKLLPVGPKPRGGQSIGQIVIRNRTASAVRALSAATRILLPRIFGGSVFVLSMPGAHDEAVWLAHPVMCRTGPFACPTSTFCFGVRHTDTCCRLLLCTNWTVAMMQQLVQAMYSSASCCLQCNNMYHAVRCTWRQALHAPCKTYGFDLSPCTISDRLASRYSSLD